MSLHLGYMWFNTPSHTPPVWLLTADRSPPWLCPQISLNRAPPPRPLKVKTARPFRLMDVANASKSPFTERFWSRSLQLPSDVVTFVTTRWRWWRWPSYWGLRILWGSYWLRGRWSEETAIRRTLGRGGMSHALAVFPQWFTAKCKQYF